MLGELDVLVIDCQASGATPAHGDLLEIGWAVASRHGLRGPLRQCFVIPRTERRVPAAVRELTGWSEACIEHALSEQAVWAALRQDIASTARAAGNSAAERVVSAIHYARFELPFLHDLHDRLGGGEAFPLDVFCLHAIAARMFPELPRRNIRALAGYLGHSTELVRRCAGHVEASAFIWQALLVRLEQQGVTTVVELRRWLEQAAPARSRHKRVFPFSSERRRALPDGPGVYRFLRSNRDVLYVGKATSIKKRVTSHFSARATAGAAKGPVATNERALELLTQVLDIDVTPTESILEAALLESDEIKRLDPPYNVQLRSGERKVWFSSSDLRSASSTYDAQHRIGPLPSQRSLSGLAALVALASGVEPEPALQACALAVPIAFLPDLPLFVAGYRAFAGVHIVSGATSAQARVTRAARTLWLARGRTEPAIEEERAPDTWDLARVQRRLERCLIQGDLLLRRARWLSLLAHADVAFRERAMAGARVLILENGQVVERRELLGELNALPVRRWPPGDARRACFDATAYDRARVLATELNRVHAEGGEVVVRLGGRVLEGARLARLLRWV